jgi:hypothetical protein
LQNRMVNMETNEAKAQCRMVNMNPRENEAKLESQRPIPANTTSMTIPPGTIA